MYSRNFLANIIVCCSAYKYIWCVVTVEKEVLTGTKLYGFSNNLEAEGLYQIILTQVSSLVIGLHHGEDFNHFERFLLKSIITDKHSQLSFVLATDLLCFVARYN